MLAERSCAAAFFLLFFFFIYFFCAVCRAWLASHLIKTITEGICVLQQLCALLSPWSRAAVAPLPRCATGSGSGNTILLFGTCLRCPVSAAFMLTSGERLGQLNSSPSSQKCKGLAALYKTVRFGFLLWREEQLCGLKLEQNVIKVFGERWVDAKKPL